jgi:hypothetical protein
MASRRISKHSNSAIGEFYAAAVIGGVESSRLRQYPGTRLIASTGHGWASWAGLGGRLAALSRFLLMNARQCPAWGNKLG